MAEPKTVSPAGGERTYRAIFNSSKDAMDFVSLDGVLVEVNGAFLRLTGYSRRELLNRRTFQDITPPEFQAAGRKAMRTILKTGRPVEFEKEYVRKDGSRIPVSLTTFLVKGREGRPEGFAAIVKDISERKRTQEALLKQQRESRVIFDSVPALVWYKDRHNRILRINKPAAEALGLPVERIEGQSTHDLYPAEAAKYHADDLEVIRSGRPKRGIIEQMPAKAGEKRWVQTDKLPYRDERGDIIGVIVFAQDISERVRAEEAVRRHSMLVELLQMVAAASNQAANADEAIQACLDGVCAYTGWPVGHAYRVPEEGKGELVSTRRWHLKARGGNRKFTEATERTSMKRGEGLPGRVWASGESLWIPDVLKDPNFPRLSAARAAGLRAGFAFPVLVKDEVAAVLEFFTDAPAPPDVRLLAAMTNIGIQLGRAMERERTSDELRRSEQLFRLLVAGVRDYAICMLDSEGRIATWNEGAERIMGHRALEAIGSPFSMFFPPEDLSRSLPQEILRSALKEGHFEHEGWRLRKDGTRFWGQIALTALRDEKGSLRGFASVTRDITERKRLEREILEAGAREQSRIGQDLHDSLGQNLTGIAFLTKALRDKLARRAVPEEADARRIAGLASAAVQQAKDLARGLVPVELQAGGLSGALRALSAHASEIFKISCDLRCSKPVSVPDEVAAVHLYRIAQEAVSNAAKHGKARKVSIGLSASDDTILLTVADDGIGIPSTEKRSKGMGLETMQYRARMMGASLEVRRGSKGGTVMICALPKASFPGEV